MSATSSEQVQAVIAFSARYFSGGPFQDPVKVLLKVWHCTVFWRGNFFCDQCTGCNSNVHGVTVAQLS